MSQYLQNSDDIIKKEPGPISWLNENLEKICVSLLMITLILLLSYEALGRYVLVEKFDLPIDLSWTEEISRIVFIWMTYLALPLTIRHHDNVRVTTLVNHLPERWRVWLEVTADALFMLFSVAILFYGTRHIRTLIIFPQVTTATNITYAILYLILPIGFTLALIRLVEDLYGIWKKSCSADIAIGFVIALVILLPALLKINFLPVVYMFGYFFVLLAIGVPIAVCLGISALITMYASATLPISYIATQAYTSIDSTTIICIPLFIAAGVFMGGEGGLSKRLLDMADAWLGGISGGLGMATVLTCMLFAAMSGSGPATVAAIGTLTIPAMAERGYDKRFAAALVAAAGTIGVMIPPSNPFIIYGVAANASVGSLFMAGISAGVLIGIVLMLYTYVVARRNNWRGEARPDKWHQIEVTTWDDKWALLVPVIILGGIYSGIATTTEAASIAALYGLLMGLFVYKSIKRGNFLNSMVNSASTSSTIILLIAMATIFGRILTLENIPAQIATAIMSISENRIVILLLLNVLLLIVGMFMEALAAIVILTPLLLPIAMEIGVDPIHFGLIMVVNLAIGFITPPVGVNLFVASGISKQRMEDISKTIVPMLLLMIAALLVVTFVPGISMWLPNMMK